MIHKPITLLQKVNGHTVNKKTVKKKDHRNSVVCYRKAQKPITKNKENIMNNNTITKATPYRPSLASGGTVFNMNFDWQPVAQNDILVDLQKAGYKLMGYKGAKGVGIVSAGLPTWFAVDTTDMFGLTDINYTPVYKVYIYNEAVIGANTTISMQVQSPEVELGTLVTFDQSGRFTTEPGAAPAGQITVKNNQSATSKNVTVGLAAFVNGAYSPFCAFTSRPQNSVNMEPNEQVCIFMAQTGLVSGSVSASSTAPGCTFPYNASNIKYDLEMIPVTLGITTRSTSPSSVTPTSSGADLAQLLNS